MGSEVQGSKIGNYSGCQVHGSQLVTKPQYLQNVQFPKMDLSIAL